MTTYLVDANVLIALLTEDHVFHDVANQWFARADSVALCPIVEGALVRTIVRLGARAATATDVLTAMHALDKVQFWPDDVSYAAASLRRVRGHKQVADTYLAALARAHDGVLATLDKPLADADERVEFIGEPG